MRTANKVFLDTAYAIALASERDDYHPTAVRLAKALQTENVGLITTPAVLLEIGNALSKERYRAGAIRLLTALETDRNIEIVPLTPELYTRAFRLFRERPDKEWGLTDCVSFVVMHDRRLSQALTADAHFKQAGFRALLLE
jgi:predicted nucleic acid-binding protein